MTEEYLTRAQVAELFNLTPGALDHLPAACALPSVRTLDRRRCYRTAPVLELARRRNLPIPDPLPTSHHHYDGNHHPPKQRPVQALAISPRQPSRATQHPPRRPGPAAQQLRDLDRLAAIWRAHGRPPWQIAEQLVDRAGITRLRAWRLATGWTRPELLARLHQLGATSIDDSMLWRWETGQRTPSASHLDALCRIYQSRPDRLGYGRDYTQPSHDRVEDLHSSRCPYAIPNLAPNPDEDGESIAREEVRHQSDERS